MNKITHKNIIKGKISYHVKDDWKTLTVNLRCYEFENTDLK